MNLLELFKQTKLAAHYRRTSWDLNTYVYVSDIDFNLYIHMGSLDPDEVFASVPDMMADDWTILAA